VSASKPGLERIGSMRCWKPTGLMRVSTICMYLHQILLPIRLLQAFLLMSPSSSFRTETQRARLGTRCRYRRCKARGSRIKILNQFTCLTFSGSSFCVLVTRSDIGVNQLQYACLLFCSASGTALAGAVLLARKTLIAWKYA